MENVVEIDASSYWAVLAKSIVKKHGNLPVRMVASRVGIAATTFSRILEGGVQRPNFSHAIKIAKAAHGNDPEKLEEAINKCYPEMRQAFNDWKEIYKGNSDAYYALNACEKFLSDPKTHEIVIKAVSGDGVHRDKILAERGKKGVRVLEVLKSEGLLEEKNGRYFTKETINASPETVYKLFENLLKYNYQLKRFGTGRNKLRVQFQSLNDEGIERLRKIEEEAAQKTRELILDKRFVGPHTMWVARVVDFLDNN